MRAATSHGSIATRHPSGSHEARRPSTRSDPSSSETSKLPVAKSPTTCTLVESNLSSMGSVVAATDANSSGVHVSLNSVAEASYTLSQSPAAAARKYDFVSSDMNVSAAARSSGVVVEVVGGFSNSMSNKASPTASGSAAAGAVVTGVVAASSLPPEQAPATRARPTKRAVAWRLIVRMWRDIDPPNGPL